MADTKSLLVWINVIKEVKELVDAGKMAAKDGFTLAEILELVNKVLGVLAKHGIELNDVSKLISELAPFIALIVKK